MLAADFLQDFTFRNQEMTERQQRIFVCLSFDFKSESSFSPNQSLVSLRCLDGHKLKTNVTFLLVCEFRELLLLIDGEKARKWLPCDHRSFFSSSSRITSRLLRRLGGVAWRIVASHCVPKPGDHTILGRFLPACTHTPLTLATRGPPLSPLQASLPPSGYPAHRTFSPTAPRYCGSCPHAL